MTKPVRPLVSILCITYNHQKYIGQALDSFLSQKTDFPVEIIVHDDASTDDTIKILKDYAAKHSNIVLALERENQFSKGSDDFIRALYKQARGTYIAICEGDDFWTDDDKLQLQVDFLENHPDHSLCFHPVRVFFDDDSQPDAVYPEENSPADFTVGNLLGHNFIQSNSVMYRAQNDIKLPSGIIPLDWYTHLYFAQFGKIGYVDKVMAAYRRHKGGMWWSTTSGHLDEIWRRYGLQHLKLFVELDKLYGSNPKYHDILREKTDSMFRAIVKTDQKYEQDHLYDALRSFPEVARTYVRDEVIRQQQAVRELTKHSDEQAKIIKHYVDMSEKLESENQHLRRKLLVRLEGAIKSPVRRIVRKDKRGHS